MGLKASESTADHDLFRTELVNLIDQRRELVRQVELIDWQAFVAQWSPQFVSTKGRRTEDSLLHWKGALRRPLVLGWHFVRRRSIAAIVEWRPRGISTKGFQREDHPTRSGRAGQLPALRRCLLVG